MRSLIGKRSWHVRRISPTRRIKLPPEPVTGLRFPVARKKRTYEKLEHSASHTRTIDRDLIVCRPTTHGEKMKLLRYGLPGQEKPGGLASDGTIRDLSNL